MNRQRTHAREQERQRQVRLRMDWQKHYRLGVKNFEKVTGKKTPPRRGRCGGGR